MFNGQATGEAVHSYPDQQYLPALGSDMGGDLSDLLNLAECS